MRVPAGVLLVTCVVGTAGYHLLWHDQGGTWLDAVYMTFITITTVGFGEVRPLGTEGRLLTMAISASGIGSLFYSFTVLLDFATSDQARAERRRRKMQKDIDALSGHFIVAGLGRVGREAVSEFREAKVPFVVVDPSEAGALWCEEHGCLFLRADATDDAVLQRAGITRARGLVVTTSDDATNLYVVLSARLLNPKLFIASRAADASSIPKLERAGANRAISPYAIGGKRLAHLLLNPRVVDFFETALKRGNQSLTIDDVLVEPTSPAAGRTLAQLQFTQKTGVTVLAVLRDGTPLANVHGDFTLAPGDHILVLGTEAQLQTIDRVMVG